MSQKYAYTLYTFLWIQKAGEILGTGSKEYKRGAFLYRIEIKRSIFWWFLSRPLELDFTNGILYLKTSSYPQQSRCGEMGKVVIVSKQFANIS